MQFLVLWCMCPSFRNNAVVFWFYFSSTEDVVLEACWRRDKSNAYDELLFTVSACMVAQSQLPAQGVSAEQDGCF